MKILIVLYDGFTEFEYAIPLMALHYHQIEYEVVGVDKREITGMTGLKASVSKMLGEVNLNAYDALLLPGIDREKREQVLQDKRLLEAIREFNRAGKLIAAVCGAPVILGAAGILKSKQFSSEVERHPALEGAVCLAVPAIRDGNVITGRGARIFHFTALLLDALVGKEKADEYRRWAGIVSG